MSDAPDTSTSDVPAMIRSAWPPLLLLAMALAFTWWAQDYRPGPRLLPTVVGVITAALCILDLLARGGTKFAAALRLTLGADFVNREMKHNPAPRAEAAQIGWMIACILAMLFIGILPAVPLFIAAYMRLFGRRSWTAAVLSALVVFVFVVLVFEVFLGTTLYRGVLFDPKGFGAW
jgi:hypothetical protein